MPPSRHSSSSHHSSSSSHRSSSSHHSSSHSSSFSRSSSSHYSSGPSRHSSSTHYSSGSSFGTSRSGRSQTISPYQLFRPRTNQPSGYRSGVDGPSPLSFHCKKHDYIYYSQPWTDRSTGTVYSQGFYDESGKLHENLTIQGTRTGSGELVCTYCGTRVKTTWTEGANPTCPNCSAPLEEPETDALSYEAGTATAFDSRGNQVIKTILIAFISLFVVTFMLSFLMVFRSSSSPAPTTPPSQSQRQDTLYVDEIGRNCKWDSDAESYYDSVTDCYFWYNNENSVPCWQYWYEGISSDYGDYGWMEYDEAEEKWYIEVSNGNWAVLPDKYPTDNLWYIREIYQFETQAP